MRRLTCSWMTKKPCVANYQKPQNPYMKIEFTEMITWKLNSQSNQSSPSFHNVFHFHLQTKNMSRIATGFSSWSLQMLPEFMPEPNPTMANTRPFTTNKQFQPPTKKTKKNEQANGRSINPLLFSIVDC